ncbi:alpha carbonic anhydrase [Lasiosphaeria hispida]|uniref:Carbonic anhydrase n=1 Tax=Lasiosphaeria hispida TaxID=260671 RepID=A0AAJ0M8Z2_9PEZI|nr:alpha carbonic anhydrase [Lasiosphaeria hispida]
MFLQPTLLLLSLLAPALGHEHYGTTLYPRAEGGASPKFGYHGLEGPLNWYSLDKEANELCAKGTHQSPINVAGASCAATPSSLSIKIPAALHGAELENLGTTVDVTTNGTLVNGGKTSELVQFHFHTPSEHAVDGKYYPMEVHFVFQAADASISVVGFLIELGPLDALLGAVLAGLPYIPSTGNVTHTKPLDFTALEKHFASSGTYQYAGSLTTPPCSEGVSWILSCKPLSVDVAGYEAITDLIKFNARYTQNNEGVNLLEHSAIEQVLARIN